MRTPLWIWIWMVRQRVFWHKLDGKERAGGILVPLVHCCSETVCCLCMHDTVVQMVRVNNRLWEKIIFEKFTFAVMIWSIKQFTSHYERSWLSVRPYSNFLPKRLLLQQLNLILIKHGIYGHWVNALIHKCFWRRYLTTSFDMIN